MSKKSYTQFKVKFLPDRNDHVKVFLFKNNEILNTWVNKNLPKKLTKNRNLKMAGGFCGLSDVLDNCYGLMLLSQEEYSIEVLSHECTHAAYAIAKLLNKTKFSSLSNEEFLCYIQASLLGKIINKNDKVLKLSNAAIDAQIRFVSNIYKF